MEHTMHLNPSSFSKIKEGTKTIELRLYDEKRRQLAVDDTICFICSGETGERLWARVVELYVFDSFKALYTALPLLWLQPGGAGAGGRRGYGALLFAGGAEAVRRDWHLHFAVGRSRPGG